MKKVFKILPFIFLLATAWPLVAAKNGGILIMRPDKVGITQTQDEAIRSIADWYTWYRGRTTMTGVITVSTTFGDSLTVKGFRNNRIDSSICFRCIYEQTRSDTDFVCIGPGESIDKMPAIYKFWIVKGVSFDSCNIKMQFNK